MDLKTRLRRIEGFEGFQATSLSPLRSAPSSHTSHVSTPLRTATPRDFKPQSISSIKSKSPAMTNRSEDTYRPPSHWSRPSDSETWGKLLAEKEKNCVNLTQAVEEMRAEMSEKNRQIVELRSIVGAYEGKLNAYFGKDYEKLLVQKSIQIQQLEEENKRFRDKLDQETQKLARLVSDGDRKLSEVRQQIVILIKKNQELESQKSTSPLYEVLQKFQRENKVLTDRLQMQTAQSCTKQQYDALEQDFHVFEDIQNRVIGENVQLKRELEEAVGREKTLAKSMSVAVKWLLDAQAELQQLLIVVKTVREGSQIDLRALLSPSGGRRNDAVPIEELVIGSKQRLGELKTLLLEVYSEYCTQACTVH
jgi:hypothetical protein